MSSHALKKLHRALHCESLEPRLVLASNAPFQPVFDLQVDSGVTFEPANGAVSVWTDQSAGNNHLFSNGSERPSFGQVQTPTGLGAISFDGIDDRLIRDLNDPGGIDNGPVINDKDRSMFLVVRFHDAGIFGGAAYGRGALDQGFGLGVGGPGSNYGDLGFQVWPDDKDTYFASEGFTTGGTSTGWMVLSIVHSRDGFDPAKNNWLYRDGVEIAHWDQKLNTKLHSTLDLNGHTASRIVLGEGIAERGHIEMDVAAWLIYDEALADADRATVESYLMTTYLDSGANEAPVATDDFVSMARGGSVVIDVLANDSDADGSLDPSTVTIVNPASQAASLTINPVTGEITYVHNGTPFNDSFTYTVRDSLGEISNTANVAIVVGSSSGELTVTAGLVGWLEADTEVTLGSGLQVLGWGDASNTNFQLTASGNPQLVGGSTPSGQPAIVFDGSGDKLELVGHSLLQQLPAGGANRTVFVVANYVNPQGVQSGFAYGKSNANRTFAVGVDGASGNLAVHGYLAANDLISSTAGAGQGWQLQSVVLESNQLSHYADGMLIDSWTHAYNTRNDAPQSKIVLGQALDETGYSQLEVAAALVYDRALSASERQQVEAYLNEKYFSGQTSNQPPVAVDDSYTVLQGGVLNTTAGGLPSVLENDTDPNFDALGAVLVSGPSHGSLTLNADGSFVYTHDGLSSADDSFTYRANDGTVNSNLATVTIVVSPLVDGNSQIVRWHGDYYHHLWDSTYPGGSAPEVRENRWLRGGPAEGNQFSQQNIDLDNDGQFDDSRVYLEFSLTNPLNPPGTNSKPGGIYYHTEMPSAVFYGGISTEFYNYVTDRVQQAFIENDGAGGELDDVGYPSPYLTPQYQGQADYIEQVRHPDGRPRKTHVGPHEDFAINLYRPDNPHPVNAGDIAADNLVAFHAAFLWRKEDFLAGGNTATVSLDAESSFSFESTRWWDNVERVRWILQDEGGQLYISQFSVSGAQDNWGLTNTFADPLSSNWAVYNPAPNDLDFNAAAATWINPVANNLFHDIQAVGLYIESDTPRGELTKFSLDEIQFNAVVTPALVAASSAPFAASIASLDSLSPQLLSNEMDDAFVEQSNGFVAVDEGAESSTELLAPSSVDDLDWASDAQQQEAHASDWPALDEALAEWLL